MTIALSRTEALPALAKPVPLSGSLAHLVRVIEPVNTGRPSIRPSGDAPTPEEAEAHPSMVPHLSPTPRASQRDVAEAVERLAEAEHACLPAAPRQIAVWCARLQVLPWGPSEVDATQRMITAIVLACGDLPAAVWTVETAALALRTFKRYPTPAEIYSLLGQHARPFLAVRDGLLRVIRNNQPDPAPAERPTPATHEHVAAVVKAFVAERSFNQAGRRLPDDAPIVKPAVLSDGALLAEYDRLASEGNERAAARAAHLRRRIAGAQT